MKTLPIDSIVTVNGYGIGIIVDVLYSSKLYRVSFQGKEHLISIYDVVPYENGVKTNRVKEKSKCRNSDNKRKVIHKSYECIDKRNTIESGDFVYSRVYGHGLVIRKVGDEDLFDCKFGKLRVCLKSEYLTKEEYSQSNFPQRTSTKHTEKPIVNYKGISHNFTTKDSSFSNSNKAGTIRHSKYALTGNSSNPANRQSSNIYVSKLSSESTIPQPTQKKLMVKFPDGTIISNDDAEETYIDALWEFNPDSIMLNRICFNGISIITSKNTKEGRVQVGVNQWAYVPSLTANIKRVLEIISKALNIEVEIHEI